MFDLECKDKTWGKKVTFPEQLRLGIIKETMLHDWTGKGELGSMKESV